jgi:hypothetical protein
LETLDVQLDSGAGWPETEELFAKQGRHQKVEIGVDAVSLSEMKVIQSYIALMIEIAHRKNRLDATLDIW